MLRADIQGLRAVAVLIVVLYHIWPESIPGGYVGVDVFFVISGFLITAHLLRELDATGTISLSRFWARRIRRLLPAAFTVLSACAIAVLVWLPRTVWERTFTEIAASALYVQNWALAGNSVDYLGAEDTDPSIVQHFWSLSVEEQFYVVWPLLILLLTMLTKSRRAVAIALGAVLVLSLVSSIWMTATHPSPAYFVTYTRAWEFAAGGLLAFLPALESARSRTAAAWLGLAAILVTGVMFTSATPFPGYAALLPVLGTVAVIWGNAPDNEWSPTHIARFAPVRFVGDISYGVYLWHWPLVVVYPVLRGAEAGIKGGVLILAMSIGLAWITKTLVEDPVRTRAFWMKQRRRAYGFAIAGMVVVVAFSGVQLGLLAQSASAHRAQAADAATDGVECFGAAAMVEDSCESIYEVPVDYDFAFGRADRGVLTDGGAGCFGNDKDAEAIACQLGTSGADMHIAVVGNSHSAALASGLNLYGQAHGWDVTLYGRVDCLGLAQRAIDGTPGSTCVAWGKDVLELLLADEELDAVVFQSYEFSVVRSGGEAAFVEQAHETWDALRAAGLPIIVVSDVPGMSNRESLAPDCVADHLEDLSACTTPRDDRKIDNPGLRAARSYEEAHVIDVTDFFCDEDRCYPMIGGAMVYFDAHHLTESYSASLAPYLAKKIKAVVTQRP